MKELGVHVGHDIGARMLVQVTTILLRRDPLVKVRVWSLELVNGHQKVQISVDTEKSSWKTVQTSQELRMLSRSLSDCKSLLLNLNLNRCLCLCSDCSDCSVTVVSL